jgi:hypothetical protein
MTVHRGLSGPNTPKMGFLLASSNQEPVWRQKFGHHAKAVDCINSEAAYNGHAKELSLTAAIATIAEPRRKTPKGRSFSSIDANSLSFSLRAQGGSSSSSFTPHCTWLQPSNKVTTACQLESQASSQPVQRRLCGTQDVYVGVLAVSDIC